MRLESFDHIHVYSKKPKEAAKFYVDFLGGEELYSK